MPASPGSRFGAANVREAQGAPPRFSKFEPRSYREFMEAMAVAEQWGMWQGALELLDEMRARGMPASDAAYNRALAACG